MSAPSGALATQSGVGFQLSEESRFVLPWRCAVAFLRCRFLCPCHFLQICLVARYRLVRLDQDMAAIGAVTPALEHRVTGRTLNIFRLALFLFLRLDPVRDFLPSVQRPR